MVSLPNPNTWVDGTVLEASDMNLHLRDGFRAVYGDEGVVEFRDGIAPVRIDTVSRDAISTDPGTLPTGTIIFNIDEDSLQVWTGTNWEAVGTGAGGGGGGVFDNAQFTGDGTAANPRRLVVPFTTPEKTKLGEFEFTNDDFPASGGSATEVKSERSISDFVNREISASTGEGNAVGTLIASTALPTSGSTLNVNWQAPTGGYPSNWTKVSATTMQYATAGVPPEEVIGFWILSRRGDTIVDKRFTPWDDFDPTSHIEINIPRSSTATDTARFEISRVSGNLRIAETAFAGNFGPTNADSHIEIRYASALGRRGLPGAPGRDGTPLSIEGDLIATTSTLPTTVGADTFVANTWTLGTSTEITTNFTTSGGQVRIDRDWTPDDNVNGYLWIALVNGVEVDRTVTPLTPYVSDITSGISTERRKLMLTDSTTAGSTIGVEMRQRSDTNQRVMQLRSSDSTTLPANTTIEVYLAVAGGAPGPVGPDGPAGIGIPAGGTDGQVLAKESNTDYDTGWIDNEPTTEEDRPVPYSVTQQSRITDATVNITDSQGAGITIPVSEISSDEDVARLGIDIQSNAYRFNILPNDRDTLLELNGLLRVGFNGVAGQFQINWEGYGEFGQGLTQLTSSQTVAVIKSTTFRTTGQRIVNIPISASTVRVRGWSGGRPEYRLRLYYLPDVGASVGTTSFTLLNTTAGVRNTISFKRVNGDSDYAPVNLLNGWEGFVPSGVISDTASTADLGAVLATNRQFSHNYIDMPRSAQPAIDAGVTRLAVDVAWLDAGTVSGDVGVAIAWRVLNPTTGTDTYTDASDTFNIDSDDGSATVAFNAPQYARGVIIQRLNGAAATRPSGQDVSITIGDVKLFYEAVVSTEATSVNGQVRVTYASGRTALQQVSHETPFVQTLSPYETLPAVPANDGVVAYQTDATRTSGSGLHVSGNNDVKDANELTFVSESGTSTAQWGYRDDSYGQIFKTDNVAEISWFDRAASPLFTLKIADDVNPTGNLFAEVTYRDNTVVGNVPYSSAVGRQEPESIAIRPNGNVYVIDALTRTTVYAMTPAGVAVSAENITLSARGGGLAFQDANNIWIQNRNATTITRYTWSAGSWTSGTTVDVAPLITANTAVTSVSGGQVHQISVSGNELYVKWRAGSGSQSQLRYSNGLNILVLNAATGAFVRVMNYNEQPSVDWISASGVPEEFLWESEVYSDETHIYGRGNNSDHMLAFTRTDLTRAPERDWVFDLPSRIDTSASLTLPGGVANQRTSAPQSYRNGHVYVGAGSILQIYATDTGNILNDPNDTATTQLTRAAGSDEVVNGTQFRAWTLNRRVTEHGGILNLRLWSSANRGTPVRINPDRVWRWLDDPESVVERVSALPVESRAQLNAIPVFDELPSIGRFPAGSLVIAPAVSTSRNLTGQTSNVFPYATWGYPAVHVAMPPTLLQRAIAEQNIIQLRFAADSGEFSLGDDIGEAVDNHDNTVYSVSFSGSGASRTISMYLLADVFAEHDSIFVDTSPLGTGALSIREFSSTDDTITADSGVYTRYQIAVPDFAISRWQTGDVIDLRFYSAYTDATDNTPIEVKSRFNYAPAYWRPLW